MTTTTTTTDNALGEALRRLMAARGVRVADVAARSGIRQPNVSRLLAGRRRPRPATLRRVLDAIGATENDLADIAADGR